MVTYPTSLFQQIFLIIFFHGDALERNVKGILVLLIFALYNPITNDVTVTRTHSVMALLWSYVVLGCETTAVIYSLGLRVHVSLSRCVLAPPSTCDAG
jgi:hypothetical protein